MHSGGKQCNTYEKKIIILIQDQNTLYSVEAHYLSTKKKQY